MPASWSSSRARSLVYATLAVLLGVTAHGAVPSLPVVVVLVALVDGIFAGLGRRHPLSAAVALVALQAPLHAVLSLTAGSHHASMVMSTGMLVAHALAAVGTALLLAFGDGLAERAAGLLQPIRALVARPPHPVSPPRMVPSDRHPVLHPALVLLRANRRRGPPPSRGAAIV